MGNRRRVLQRRRQGGELTLKTSVSHVRAAADNGRVVQYFYNDVFRYSPEKVSLLVRYLQWERGIYVDFQGRMAEVRLTDMPWTQIRSCGSRYFRRGRKAVSVRYDFPNPLRKSEEITLVLLRRIARTGGEFSSLYQNSFHHYRDFWCFDVSTQSWDRIDTKIRPTARSGHRYVTCSGQDALFPDRRVVGWPFGNTISPFSVVSTTQDIPVRSLTSVDCLLPDIWAANYLNDLWLFDMQEYKWKQIVMKDNERKPSWVFNVHQRSFV